MKVIDFKGFKFNVRHDLAQSPPGNNIRHRDNAFLRDGELVLQIKKIKDQWTSAEIILEDTKKEGVYILDLEKPRFLNKSLVAAVFLYENDKNELDIEFTQWNHFFLPNVWVTEQDPYRTKMSLSFKKDHLIVIQRDKDKELLVWNKKLFTSKKIKNGKLMISLWHYGNPKEAEIKIKDIHYIK